MARTHLFSTERVLWRGWLKAMAVIPALAACGNIPNSLTPVDVRIEQQTLQQTYPEAVGFAFLDPLNSGLVLNLDGSGTYIRNAEDPALSHEYLPITITDLSGEAVCFGIGCLSLSMTDDGARVCDVSWSNGNRWRYLCTLVPIPPGFAVTSLNRPGL